MDLGGRREWDGDLVFSNESELSDTEEMDEDENEDTGNSDNEDLFFIPQQNHQTRPMRIYDSEPVELDGINNAAATIETLDGDAQDRHLANTQEFNNEANSGVAIIYNVEEVDRVIHMVNPYLNEESAEPEHVDEGNETVAAEGVQLIRKGSRSAREEVSGSEDESQTCPICFENWTNAGLHRIVSLKCGHLFGKDCIERWLRNQGSSRCPQCKVKAHKRDIRILYAKSVKVEDTAEKERLALQIQKLKEEKELSEREKAQLRLKVAAQTKLNEELEREIKALREASVLNASSGTGLNESASSAGCRLDVVKGKFKLSLFHTFDLIKTGSCRVMAFNDWMKMLVVSVPSQLEMFPGFGIKKVNALDLKVENFLHLHSKQIRDLAFNPVRKDYLLSVGFDKMAKVTNVSSNSTVASYTTNYPLWSCCWHSTNTSEFFVGTSIGIVYRFNTLSEGNEPVSQYEVGHFGPAVSLTHIPPTPHLFTQGLLVTRFGSVSFLEINAEGNEAKAHSLPLNGSFIHTYYERGSNHFLTTCRPNDRHLHARHFFCQLTSEYDHSTPQSCLTCTAREVHRFQGSTTMKVLSRAALAPNRGRNRVVAVFSEESTASVKVYDVSSGSLIQTLKPGINVMDILPFEGVEEDYIAVLSEKCLKLYKWSLQE